MRTFTEAERKAWDKKTRDHIEHLEQGIKRFDALPPDTLFILDEDSYFDEVIRFHPQTTCSGETLPKGTIFKIKKVNGSCSGGNPLMFYVGGCLNGDHKGFAFNIPDNYRLQKILESHEANPLRVIRSEIEL